MALNAFFFTLCLIHILFQTAADIYLLELTLSLLAVLYFASFLNETVILYLLLGEWLTKGCRILGNLFQNINVHIIVNL